MGVAGDERGGYRLIGVVFGGRSSKQRDRHMVNLLDKGFRRVDTTLAAALRNVADKPAREKSRRVAIAAGAISRRLAITPGLDWGVQVGAYRTYTPAHDIARKAKKKAIGLLDGGCGISPTRTFRASRDCRMHATLRG